MREMPRSRLSSSATLLPSVAASRGAPEGFRPAGSLNRWELRHGQHRGCGPTTGVARAPSAAVLCAVVVAGLAAAACTILLALTSDHIPEPGVHAGLAGLGDPRLRPRRRRRVVAATREPVRDPDGAGRTAWFLSTLSSANLAIPYTIGITFDLFPAVVFLHVVLAFPNGRLERPFERALSASGMRRRSASMCSA